MKVIPNLLKEPNLRDNERHQFFYIPIPLILQQIDSRNSSNKIIRNNVKINEFIEENAGEKALEHVSVDSLDPNTFQDVPTQDNLDSQFYY